MKKKDFLFCDAELRQKMRALAAQQCGKCSGDGMQLLW